MKSTKQSVSFSCSKSISFMARGKGGFLNPFPSKRSLLPPLRDSPPRETNGWGNSLPGLVKIQGNKNLWSPKHVPYPFYTRVCQCSKGFPVFQSRLSADYSWEKLSQGLRDESHSEHEEHFEVFLFQTVLGSLKSDCKVMVYFSTSAWLRNEEYLNDEGSMINRVVFKWLRSSQKTELSQSPNWIKHRAKTWNPSSEIWGAPGAPKQYFKIFLTKQFPFFFLFWARQLIKCTK